jgi:hypothetical protein
LPPAHLGDAQMDVAGYDKNGLGRSNAL